MSLFSFLGGLDRWQVSRSSTAFRASSAAQRHPNVPGDVDGSVIRAPKNATGPFIVLRCFFSSKDLSKQLDTMQTS